MKGLNFDWIFDARDENACYREVCEDNCWWCVNDHTGCMYNDGHNTCCHPGNSMSPLEEVDEE